MTGMERIDYSPLYLAYLHYFNVERDYFECHEVLEELWLEEGRNLLYQGLLQVAVALYHHRNDNRNGARKMFAQAVNKLRQFPNDSLGIDLGRLLEESERYWRQLENYDEAPFEFYDLTIRIIDPVLKEQVEEWAVHKHLPDDDH
ncbi:DUF309 domain-containing protein [Paenibacillus sp. J2TS4]|uniref:DUF309 domain-containing protein n=1 Tax=Paenibacillus sp. J2TS4 TaxID=2807194 RepID=UPI001B028A33|nr:DUF309 domain-containing protein [Paenibacillus sp. J2TS4]GIP33917.1 hypothetical protein J2TS4_31270 [Paenibacillus sp. J2TS4]